MVFVLLLTGLKIVCRVLRVPENALLNFVSGFAILYHALGKTLGGPALAARSLALR